MNTFKLVCWLLIIAGFVFGISDRWLQADLFSLGIAACFSLLVIPLCPWLK